MAPVLDFPMLSTRVVPVAAVAVEITRFSCRLRAWRLLRWVWLSATETNDIRHNSNCRRRRSTCLVYVQRFRYELLVVEAYHPKFRQSRMPYVIATRMPHNWYHADRHEQWKRVRWPVFFLLRTYVGLALAAKKGPDQSQAFKEVNNSPAFTVGRKKNEPFFFWTSRFQVRRESKREERAEILSR